MKKPQTTFNKLTAWFAGIMVAFVIVPIVTGSVVQHLHLSLSQQSSINEMSVLVGIVLGLIVGILWYRYP